MSAWPLFPLLFASSAFAGAIDLFPGVDDSDLATDGKTEIRRSLAGPDLSPDELSEEPDDGAEAVITLDLSREQRPGEAHPVAGLVFERADGSGAPPATTNPEGRLRGSFGCKAPGEGVRLAAKLESPQFAVTDGQRSYRIVLDAKCGALTHARFRSDSDAGQAVGIWQIGQAAKERLSAAVGLAFWTSRLDFVWPSGGDYYQWGQVNVTRGDHWDVVGHELGHGIYDLADIGSFGGGQHRIDECYTSALALSEGWASYFSGWLGVALDDPDAKFEFLVPRRAPIRFEIVPEDVCNGPTNEWRVTSFLWDVIDLTDDGEGSTEPFARVWRALTSSGSRSIDDAYRKLAAAGIPREALSVGWLLNFRAPEPRGLAGSPLSREARVQ